MTAQLSEINYAQPTSPLGYGLTLKHIDFLSLQQERFKAQVEAKNTFIAAYLSCDSLNQTQKEALRKYVDLYHIQEANARIKDYQNNSLQQSLKKLQKDLAISERKLIFVTSGAIATTVVIIVYFVVKKE